MSGFNAIRISFSLDFFVTVMVLTDAAFPVWIVFPFEIAFFTNSYTTFLGCCNPLARRATIMGPFSFFVEFVSTIYAFRNLCIFKILFDKDGILDMALRTSGPMEGFTSIVPGVSALTTCDFHVVSTGGLIFKLYGPPCRVCLVPNISLNCLKTPWKKLYSGYIEKKGYDD